ncbi:hypothetical protein K2X14_08360 [Acetobacter sp. TBRC 12305]|uniref:Uncharacterized protein n=1 Tax=Acetobacter garciniae TaxID=2817435 RepID=A0A939HKJ7_9PROT|nr:hypothetical protein [Acetobacter garciniae]MBO1325187.1 hypothetical protein [Acetobacter garciniae]MBX0344842.1 hypothetical protein [Acetobacter garciniae]
MKISGGFEREQGKWRELFEAGTNLSFSDFMLCIHKDISSGVRCVPAGRRGLDDVREPSNHYAICYPSRLLKGQATRDFADEQRFSASDGGALSIFERSYFRLEHGKETVKSSLPELVNDESSYMKGRKGKITYDVIRKNWAVFSGNDGIAKEFYEKIIRQDYQFVVFEIEYPISERDKYKPIVERVARCFSNTPPDE